MRPFEYIAPASLEEAAKLLGPGTRALAGGTDLLTLMKPDLAAPDRLVSLKKLLPCAIKIDSRVVEIGAGVTLGEIENHRELRSRCTALAQAAEAAASAQLRNMATVGGNLLQRPRCWYFRDPLVHCWLKGGAQCQARDGENAHHALFGASPCVAAHPSDPAAALLALDATALVRGPRGEREIALERLFALPEDRRRSETTLGEDELILALRIPVPQAGMRSTYLKAMERGTFSFALVGVAAVMRSVRNADLFVRIVLSGVAPVPWRAHGAEHVLAGGGSVEQAAEAALEGAAPLSRNAYKIPLAKALVKRALRALVGA